MWKIRSYRDKSVIREINILDANDIQEIYKDELGYDVDIKTVKAQIEKIIYWLWTSYHRSIWR